MAVEPAEAGGRVRDTAGLCGLQGACDAIKTGAEASTVLLPNG